MSYGPTSPSTCQSLSMLLVLCYLPTIRPKRRASMKPAQNSQLFSMLPVPSMARTLLSLCVSYSTASCMVSQNDNQISFGTVFWPTAQDYVDEVVDALIEKEFPFVRFSNLLCIESKI
jgi:hypothetical protein